MTAGSVHGAGILFSELARMISQAAANASLPPALIMSCQRLSVGSASSVGLPLRSSDDAAIGFRMVADHHPIHRPRELDALARGGGDLLATGEAVARFVIHLQPMAPASTEIEVWTC